MHGLGELEAAVMNVLWDAAAPLKVRDVLDSAADPHAVLTRFVETVTEEETDLLRTALRKKRIRRR